MWAASSSWRAPPPDSVGALGERCFDGLGTAAARRMRGGERPRRDRFEPRARVRPSPAYPFSLKADGVSGEVLVEFVVDESGRVLNPRIIRSTRTAFEGPTLSAVARWRFEPGTRRSKPVRFKMVVPVKFSLND